MTNIANNLSHIRSEINLAAQNAQRDPESVNLLAVSKTRPTKELLMAWQEGQRDFGENYLQEALEKIDALQGKGIRWHFIGPIQSNKTRPIAESFDWVHSVDRLKVAQRLSAQRPDSMEPLNICLQVNISKEATKSGILPVELSELAKEVAALPNIRLRGLMAIPASSDNPVQQRQPFAELQQLLNSLQQQLPEQPLDTLSMGMSGDMEAAIQEGSTMVRIGTALFGPRDYSNQS